MYAHGEDLRRYLTQQQFDNIIRVEDSSEDYAIQALEDAESYVKERLNYKYDMETELAKTGSERNRTLIKIIARLAIYDLSLAMDLLDEEGKYYQMKEEAKEDLSKIEMGTLLSDYLTFQNEDKQTILYGTDNSSDLKY